MAIEVRPAVTVGFRSIEVYRSSLRTQPAKGTRSVDGNTEIGRILLFSRTRTSALLIQDTPLVRIQRAELAFPVSYIRWRPFPTPRLVSNVSFLVPSKDNK